MQNNIFLSFEKKMTSINGFFFKISMLFTIILPIPIVIDVVLRTLLNISIFGVIEISEISLLCIVFFSLANLQSKDDHIRIELIDHLISKNAIEYLNLSTNIISLGFFSFIFYATFVTIEKKIGEVSLVFGLPMPILISITTFGLLLLTFTFIAQIGRQLNDLIQKKSWSGIVFAFIGSKYMNLSPPGSLLVY